MAPRPYRFRGQRLSGVAWVYQGLAGSLRRRRALGLAALIASLAEPVVYGIEGH
jgi:hypothetical protein